MKSEEFLTTLGSIVKRARSKTMDQADFAQRVGCGVATLSRLENGQPVNAETLFTALELLGLLDDYIAVGDEQNARLANAPLRKKRKPESDLPNDF